MNDDQNKADQRLKPYFSRPGTWAFSIGTSVGWGSFVVTCNTYLSQAGTAGTISGILLGMAVILIINNNLCYMMENCPDAGGLYTYCGKVRNRDTGFLMAWFLLLTCLAVLWANITSLPLFAGRFIGSFFQFGFCYSVFGYKVYLGEVLLTTLVYILMTSGMVEYNSDEHKTMLRVFEQADQKMYARKEWLKASEKAGSAS